MSDTNRAVQPQKIGRCLKFRVLQEVGLYYLCSEKKAQISCVVTAQLISGFVFAYAKPGFLMTWLNYVNTNLFRRLLTLVSHHEEAMFGFVERMLLIVLT